MIQLSFAESFYLCIVLIVGYLFARAAVNVAVVADMPKPPPRKTLAWVHYGLVEPQPWDDTRFGRTPDQIYGGRWAGETTQCYPMVFQLRDEPDPFETPAVDDGFVGRERFAAPPSTPLPKPKPKRQKLSVKAMPEAPAQLTEVAS